MKIFYMYFIFTQFNFHVNLKTNEENLYRVELNNCKRNKLLVRERYSTFVGTPLVARLLIRVGIGIMHRLHSELSFISE